MIVLGIESSCDETAASIVNDGREILSNIVLSQIEEHKAFKGVVPEIAARSHLDHLDSVIGEALQKAHVSFEDLDGIAATSGPGLIGGLIVGVMMAKSIALVHKKPFIAVNHLEGHALTARLTHNVSFPYLLLLMSGGHCQLIVVKDVGQYELLGTTIDDAVGEAFDKVAKMLDVGYPGGPAVEQMAKEGNPKAFHFPRPLKGRPDCNFSFAGLKTAVFYEIKNSKSDINKEDLCASFQQAACDSILDRVEQAFKQVTLPTIVVAGGVAANQTIRATLQKLCQKHEVNFVAPPIGLCTDNGAMIAWAGLERLQRGLISPLDFKPRPRWPLEELKG